MLRLKEKYKKEVIPQLVKKFELKNIMSAPKIEKVIINTGFGKLVAGKPLGDQKKSYESIIEDLTLIIGQKPALKLAKKSIAGFKIRKGMVLGASIVLRKERMYDFLERLINIVIPRIRDFQGIKQDSVDEKGNLTYGIKEHFVFPEILPEKIKNSFGLEVTVVTSAKDKEQGLELLRLMGFPIKK